MSNPAVAAFARDARLLEIAGLAVGMNPVPFRATLFEKTAQANWLIAWHQDTALPLVESFEAPGWGPWSQKDGFVYSHAPAWALERVIALRIHLDESATDNGPLRVVPNSHRDGVLSDAEIQQRLGSNVQIECLSQRGGVITMRPLLIHASSRALSDAPRRVLHIEYTDNLQLAAGIRLAIA
jgi:ectoine hydroxylase-related dioxygenase (phytanoyl-CoA dioxygenase family)